MNTGNDFYLGDVISFLSSLEDESIDYIDLYFIGFDSGKGWGFSIVLGFGVPRLESSLGRGVLPCPKVRAHVLGMGNLKDRSIPLASDPEERRPIRKAYTNLHGARRHRSRPLFRYRSDKPRCA